MLGGKIRSNRCFLYCMPSALHSTIFPLYSLLAALYRCPDVRPADQPRLVCEGSVYIAITARSESLNRCSFNRSYLPLYRSALVRVAKIRGYSVHSLGLIVYVLADFIFTRVRFVYTRLAYCHLMIAFLFH